jgi:MFS family permease
MIGFAVGAIAVGAVLARIRVRAKARTSMLAWLIYLPAYGLIAVTGSLPLLVLAAIGTGAGETISYVLLNSAAQEEIPDAVLGRVLGVISFVHRGAHATGLLLVAPLFAVAAARPLFGAAACLTAAVGLVGALLALRIVQGPAAEGA